MRVDELFDVEYGNSLSLNKLTRSTAADGIAFVSRSAQNSGIVAWVERVKDVEPFPAGLLTVSLRSRNHALATFVQTRPFYTAYHLYVLAPREEMTVQTLLWWSMCIERNRYRYNYGRQANRSLAALELPDAVPEWVEQATIPDIDASPVSDDPSALADCGEWGWFSFEELFVLHRGGGVVRREAKAGTTPLVSASAKDNGVTARVAGPGRFPAGWLTVCSNGSVGEAFVQPEPFVATADVTVLEPRQDISFAAGLFLCAVIEHEKYRFNYGRKWPSSRMAQSKIRLPVLASGDPDYEGMTSFMEAMPFSRFAEAIETAA